MDASLWSRSQRISDDEIQFSSNKERPHRPVGRFDESDSQNEKENEPIMSTLVGIKIDRSDENENADQSICVKREFDSETIDLMSRCDFRKTIELGIHTCSISAESMVKSRTVLTESSSTTS
jgi:hypothetical protein